MPVEFRCEKCGKLLNMEAERGAMVACPYCKAKVVAPASVASLPRPRVPPGSAPPPPAAPPEQAEPEPVGGGEDAVINVMAAIMPWLISLFFHVGLLVILGFITIVVIREDPPVDVIAASEVLSPNPGGVVNPGETYKELTAKSLIRNNQKKWSQRDSKMSTATVGETESRVSVFGAAGGGGGGEAADFGRMTGGSGRGPRSKFFGTGGNAHHIVYVVDSSGSMMETFDRVRNELRRSILRLAPTQTFHVIFYRTGKPTENPPRRLVYATDDEKRKAMEFLGRIETSGQTDPIPALERAFSVLKSRPGNKKGMLIYLLSDGEFDDNDLVLRRIRELNVGGRAHVNTILYHFDNPQAEKVLTAIANQNGGRYKYVQVDD